ncbi:uncharacterized protein MKK02DRAFT_32250 [Dioszegia hungarica]|uniref:Uncharacterized protein n=1 Tax=Dioszegia hungarica TaxID=4972 RepID=A0AA38HAN8_9TREE|nr:uncharacterized protein MKK02DRAFT_32250 [Dioszegia hungarica]KAI9637390.1 hypothetical protein MKK02DRAFT_32250 [Dioszegia hungarica]
MSSIQLRAITSCRPADDHGGMFRDMLDLPSTSTTGPSTIAADPPARKRLRSGTAAEGQAIPAPVAEIHNYPSTIALPASSPIVGLIADLIQHRDLPSVHEISSGVALADGHQSSDIQCFEAISKLCSFLDLPTPMRRRVIDRFIRTAMRHLGGVFPGVDSFAPILTEGGQPKRHNRPTIKDFEAQMERDAPTGWLQAFQNAQEESCKWDEKLVTGDEHRDQNVLGPRLMQFPVVRQAMMAIWRVGLYLNPYEYYR